MRAKSLWLLLFFVAACRENGKPPPSNPAPAPVEKAGAPARTRQAVTVAAPETGGPAEEDVDPSQLFAPGKKELQAAPARPAGPEKMVAREAEAPSIERSESKADLDRAEAKPRSAPPAASAPRKKSASFGADDEMPRPHPAIAATGTRAAEPSADFGGETATTMPDPSYEGAIAAGPKGAFGNGLPRRPVMVAKAPPRRVAPTPAGSPYRPLPAPPVLYPRDARYRSNYLPGRGYLEHLRASLAGDRTFGAVTTAVLASPTAARHSLPAPEGRALDVAIDQLHGALPPAGGETTLRVRLRAAEATPRPRAALRVHLVIDGSGSMTGEPWRSVCAAVRDVAARLAATDRMSVTMYDTHARILSPSVVGGADADAVAERVCAIRPRGNTNIYEGLMTGYEQARAVYDPRAINRVILLSDGIATAGPRNVEAITAGPVEALGLGITTSAVGVGKDFDALLMGRIASEGAGNYHFARDHRTVTSVFSDELAVLAEEAAEAIEVRVFLNPDVDLVEVIGSEPLGVVASQRARQVEMATDQRLAQDQGIAADRQWDKDGGVRFLIPSFRLADEHTFLLRVRVPPDGGSHELIVSRVKVRYKDMLFARNQRLFAEQVAWYGASPDEAEGSRRTDLEVAEARARAAYSLERASQYLHPRNVSGIRRELYAAASGLTGAADRSSQVAVREEARRVQQLADLAGRATSPKQLGYLAGLYHYGWRKCGLAFAE